MRISAMAVTVPQNVLGISELNEKFGNKTILRISSVTGVCDRHAVAGNMRALELLLNSAEKAIEKSGGSRNFDAVLVVTQTPEYKFPATACIVQDKLKISTKALAFDINLGCSGFVYGLITANSFIESGNFKRILLIVGDLTQSTASPQDSSTYPLFGDAYSATVLEADESVNDFIASDYGTDGSGSDDLITYVGGCRYRTEEEFRNNDGYKVHGDVKYPEYVYMNGAKIFEFSVNVVPETLNKALKNGGFSISNIDFFFFHQANGFILKHLCKKLNIDECKVPKSLEHYGNTSSASIPLTICSQLGEDQSQENLLTALVGFGIGYSWASVLIRINPQTILPIFEI